MFVASFMFSFGVNRAFHVTPPSLLDSVLKIPLEELISKSELLKLSTASLKTTVNSVLSPAISAVSAKDAEATVGACVSIF